MFDIKGKVAVVTGGGRGLGKEMALGLGEAGAHVVVCSRNLAACEEVRDSLMALGVKSLAFSCDVTKKEDVVHIIEETVKEFGRIDILINNSGTSWAGPFLDVPADKWDKVMDVNVKGTFLFSQEAAKVMVKQKSGKIINIASVSGFGGTDPRLMDTVPYNASKGAVITLTKDLAVKLASHNIQVNAIAPGFFPTKITKQLFAEQGNAIMQHIPAKRFGEGEDLRGIAVFLSSAASQYVNGHILIVDGGISAQA
ncbi:gluconate 5-dehydrogenase [[Bacillus] enclensis]|uniref:Gluconate 5-dehydrogenase n=1 Tax=[Bacillus] enclensis TaxID=1402860 RepID=A0A0V8HBQ5_9BACI|nr:SDR family oxidoreductase [[Bacillus] enclensis]KSU59863.1 gluconate 5-dehydrogenase [[Bacillus] enclensis]SCC28135.1 gluconate 5-dehydrogenase [[Bacillus] enclensis]